MGLIKEQDEILVAIDKYGGKLTQDEFDSEFKETIIEVQKDGSSILNMKLESFILGGMLQRGYWSKYRHLSQG